MKKIIIFLGILSSFISTSAFAVTPEPFSDCSNPYHLESFYGPKDFHKTEVRALKGDVQSQIKLGSYYMYGTGTCVDYVKARTWFEMAAEKNNAYAISNLGSIYLDGFENKIPKDYSKALMYLNKCADMNVDNCYYNLGVMYRDGFGVVADEEKAINYFYKTAYKGDVNAQSNLGLIMFKNKQYMAAKNWFLQAAQKNDVDAQYHLYLMFKDGLLFKKDEQKALEWLEISAQNKHYEQSDMSRGNVIDELAHKYEDGIGLERPNDLLALSLFDLAHLENGYSLDLINEQKLSRTMSDKQLDFVHYLTKDFQNHNDLIKKLHQWK